MESTHSRFKVLGSGIFCLMLTMAIARFAYTPMLPIMFEQTALNVVTGGWLATINYIGYMVGALTASLVVDLVVKDRLYRLGLLLSIISTLMMGLSDDMWLWGLSRFIAGFATATGLLMGSGLMLNWLLRHHYRSEMGIHFSGIGLGIVVVALFISWSNTHLSWSEQWLVLAFIGVFLAIPAWRWLPRPESTGLTMSGGKLEDKPPSRLFFKLMMFVYFCAGFGFVISATYIVAIVESQSALKGQGDITFLILGLAAAPACILWDYVSRYIGILNALLCAFIVHAIGIVLPALGDGLWFALSSAVLYGVTFVGIVSIVLTMAGRFYPTKPAKLMGILTMSYGVPQIVGPTIAGYLVQMTGSFHSSLYMATGFVIFGALGIVAIQLFTEGDIESLE